MMKENKNVWLNEEVAKNFLDNVRGSLPLSKEQIEIVLKLINHTQKKVNRFLDLGCGDGILGNAILVEHPESNGIFLDFSETMINAAKEKLKSFNDRSEFVTLDYGNINWYKDLADNNFDVIVSGFSIHHQSDERKKAIYKEIYDLLVPGGIFLNLEHVLVKSDYIENFANELIIDSLFSYQKKKNPLITREKVKKYFLERDDKDANILASVENQCEWLKEIGYKHVDCYFKWFMAGLFGGIKTL